MTIRGRRGFTLVEVMVVMVMMLLVGAALTRVLVNSMRVSRAQMLTADMQSNVRTGTLVLPMELRELGYDSNLNGVVRSDISAIAATSIQFEAARGFSFLCGAFDLPNGAEGTLRIRKPVMGLREPQLGDGFQVYVENNANTGIDDQWLDAQITAIDLNGVCDGGGDPAIILTVSSNGISTTGDGLGTNPDVVVSQMFVGAPVRWYEVMNFGSFVDADGMTYLGARSVSQGEANYRPIAGPLDAGLGVRFTYYDKNGLPVVPGVGQPVSVRTVELIIVGQTGSPVALAGTRLATRNMPTTTRVALRNTLRH
jgi:prepilin-type N-terminal cleavage/methylation domain-containing protein